MTEDIIIQRIVTMLYHIKNPKDRRFLVVDPKTERELKNTMYYAENLSLDGKKFMGMELAIVDADEDILEIR